MYHVPNSAFVLLCSCMEGYINDTLSMAYMSHEAVRADFSDWQMTLDNKINVTECRWEDQFTLLSPNICIKQDNLCNNCMSHVCAAIETTGAMKTTL